MDYKKLLIRCMEQWFDSEGCCWNGDGDWELTQEEQNELAKIHDQLLKEQDERVAIDEVLEDWDGRSDKQKGRETL